MHPLDALNPKISDEELVISYGCVITDLVTDKHTVSDVIRNDRIESHKWFTDLLLLIFEGYEEPLAYWDLAPKIVRELQEEIKRLRELLVEAAHCIHEMEGMAYAGADPDDFSKHALEFRGNVSETIGSDAPWGEEE